MLFTKDTSKNIKNRDWKKGDKKTYQENTTQKISGVSIVLSGKTSFTKPNSEKENKKEKQGNKRKIH